MLFRRSNSFCLRSNTPGGPEKAAAIFGAAGIFDGLADVKALQNKNLQAAIAARIRRTDKILSLKGLSKLLRTFSVWSLSSKPFPISTSLSWIAPIFG